MNRTMHPRGFGPSDPGVPMHVSDGPNGVARVCDSDEVEGVRGRARSASRSMTARYVLFVAPELASSSKIAYCAPLVGLVYAVRVCGSLPMLQAALSGVAGTFATTQSTK